MTNRVYNFYAGPATMPLPALEKAKEEFLDFAGTGMSVLEISHRTKEWQKAAVGPRGSGRCPSHRAAP